MKWIGKLAGGLLGGSTSGRSAPRSASCSATSSTSTAAAAAARRARADVAAIGERFFRATFRVMGYLAKADGRVSEQEIAAARAVMTELRLNAAQVREAIALLHRRQAAQFRPRRASSSALAARLPRAAGPAARVPRDPGARRARRQQPRGPGAPDACSASPRALGISALELAQIEAVLRIQRGALRAGRARRAVPARAAAARDRELQEAYRVLETQRAVRAMRRWSRPTAGSCSRHHPDKLKANGLPESMLGARQAAHAADHRGLGADPRSARHRLKSGYARPLRDDGLDGAHAVGERRRPGLQDER